MRFIIDGTDKEMGHISVETKNMPDGFMHQKESSPAKDGAATNFVVYLDSKCRKAPKIHQVLRGKQFEQKRQKQREFRTQALCAALASAERAGKSGRCE